MSKFLRRFNGRAPLCLFRERRGSVAFVAAIMLLAAVVMSGLAVEYGYGLVLKAENQRVADVGAYAGALAYNAAGSTTAMTGAVGALTALNGLLASNATSTLVASPSGDGNSAVDVTVTTQGATLISSIVTNASSVSVASKSSAEIKTQSAACIIALSSSGSGIALTGGTSITAVACGLASNVSVSVPCGTSVTTLAITYKGAAPSQPCSGIKPSSGHSSVAFKQAASSDPFSGSTNVSGAVARLSTVAAQSAPGSPSVPAGTNLSFDYSTTPTTATLLAAGCVGSFASPTWTVTCSGNGPFAFGSLSLSGGITVKFNTSGSSSATSTFSGSVTNSGTSLSFGPGTIKIAQGLITGGGSVTSFASSTVNIGRAPVSCNGGGTYSICNTGTSLSFTGPVAMTLQGGLYNSGGATMAVGSGTNNSYQFGASSDGNAIYIGGGSHTTLADATGANDVFQINGNMQAASGGGSCVTLPAAAQHDITGNLVTAGGVNLGAGVYTIGGFVGIGTDQYGDDSGGDVTCNGQTTGVNANGVTFVIGASSTPTSGSCLGQAFCVTAGYGHVVMVAPTSGATQQFAVIDSGGSAGASFAEGGSVTSVSGVFYFPRGSFTLSGGSSIGGASGQCLELVATQLSLSGGSTIASQCPGTGATVSSGGVKFVE